MIEKAQQDHIEAQREYVELHEKIKLKKGELATKTPLQSEREKLEQIEKDYNAGWRDAMRERIGVAGGKELQRAGMEARLIGEKADRGKTFTANAARSQKRRVETPAKERLF